MNFLNTLLFYTLFKRLKSVLKPVLYFFCIYGLFFSNTYGIMQIHADIDKVNSFIEYSKVPHLKLGDYIQLNAFSFGGFIELRNEPRFNQGVFPNHNWRGFIFLEYDIPIGLFSSNPNIHFSVPIGIEHESAHPTMGIRVSTDNPEHKIYDDIYRNINLNSARIGFTTRYKKIIDSYLRFDYHLFFLSRNTPELNDPAFGNSHGLSIGIDLNYQVISKVGFFISIFDRVIFKGFKEVTGNIYMEDSNGDIQQVETPYPVINAVNQLAFSIGVFFPIKKIKKKASLYFKFIYGNKGGFIDSRAIESLYMVGIGLENF